MFLSTLNDNERKGFCSLVQLVASCDNDFSELEKLKIQEYLIEMELEDLEPLTADIDETIALFEKSTVKVKHSIFLEIVSFVLSDARFESCERSIVDRVGKAFGINDVKKKKYIDSVMEMKLLTKLTSQGEA